MRWLGCSVGCSSTGTYTYTPLSVTQVATTECDRCQPASTEGASGVGQRCGPSGARNPEPTDQELHRRRCGCPRWRTSPAKFSAWWYAQGVQVMRECASWWRPRWLPDASHGREKGPIDDHVLDLAHRGANSQFVLLEQIAQTIAVDEIYWRCSVARGLGPGLRGEAAGGD